MLLTNFLTIHILLNLLLTSLFYFYSVFSSAFLYVFGGRAQDQTGKLLRSNFVSDHFTYLIKKFGLKKIRFHDLRHTCASLLLANGVPIKQIQIWLGHSNFSTTADIYAHLDMSAQIQTGSVAEALFGQDKSLS